MKTSQVSAERPTESDQLENLGAPKGEPGLFYASPAVQVPLPQAAPGPRSNPARDHFLNLDLLWMASFLVLAGALFLAGCVSPGYHATRKHEAFWAGYALGQKDASFGYDRTEVRP